MPRVDFHILHVRGRGWLLQTAQGTTLAAFADSEAALEAARQRGRELEEKGLNARVHLHLPGKAPEVFDYPAA